jgi:hypothetical protein
MMRRPDVFFQRVGDNAEDKRVLEMEHAFISLDPQRGDGPKDDTTLHLPTNKYKAQMKQKAATTKDITEKEQ